LYTKYIYRLCNLKYTFYFKTVNSKMFLYIIESKISDLSTIWTFTAPLNVEEETIRVLKEIAHLE